MANRDERHRGHIGSDERPETRERIGPGAMHGGRRFRDEAERGGRALGGGVRDGSGAVVGYRSQDGGADYRTGYSGYDEDRGGFVDDYRGGPGSGGYARDAQQRRRGSGFGAFGFNDDARPRDAATEGNDEGAGSFRGRGPKSYQRSDARILEDVNDRLTDDPHLDASEIEVRVENREVTLAGSVPSRFEKRHAEDIAESVSGVTHVQNNLRIAAPQHHGSEGGLDTAGAAGAGGGRSGPPRSAGGPGGSEPSPHRGFVPDER